MNDKAYSYMNWAAIEGLVYSEEKNPKEIMAPKKVREGVLYQCLLPGASEVRFKDLRTGKMLPMALEDEAGYFAVVVPGKEIVPHSFVTGEGEYGDPYAFGSLIEPEAESRFTAGIADRAYKILGAHVTEAEGISGVLFAVWAPNAIRVSVVGPFSGWDGRMYPMEFHEESGIFELFIPGLAAGTDYKYEIKLKTGLVYTRPDPYAFRQRVGSDPVSIVTEVAYKWHDRDYLTKRSGITDTKSKPIAIYECSLASVAARADKPEEVTYRTLADQLAPYVKHLGYTHIELNPVMEYANNESGGFHTTGYFAPTSRYGSPEDFKYFVDTMHGAGIGVILDWTPAQFSQDTNYLAAFDGTGLYEHIDPRQGVHPLWGTKIFNYGRPQVRSFLLSSADFWMRVYHADGLRLDGCSTMLRLDYMRGNAWVANLYGSWENLEGIEFLRRLSGIMHRSYPDGMLIMTEDVDWPEVTASTEENGLGADYEWNLHFTQDLLQYLSLNSAGRKKKHDILTNGMLHHYFENFIISLSRGIGAFDKQTFMSKVDGTDAAKAALVRCAYGYLFMHPGKKLLTEGEAWSDAYLKALLTIYTSEPALSVHDYDEDGFEWINTMDSEHSVLSFLRKGDTVSDTLVVVCNFSDEDFSAYDVGVPYAGKYKEILNSDATSFGGTGRVNPRAKATRAESADERECSLRLRIAPRSIAVFKYQVK